MVCLFSVLCHYSAVPLKVGLGPSGKNWAPPSKEGDLYWNETSKSRLPYWVYGSPRKCGLYWYTMSTGRYHQQGLITSSPTTSWQIDGEEMERVTDLIFLGSKITADGNCSHEIKRHLLLGRKAMTNLDSIRKAETLLCQQSMHSQSYGFSSSHVQM